MKRHWIKMYIELLDDPKMGQLPDWQWRRAIELFLLAGENGNDGLLPPVTQMAWRLRLDETKLSESLRALSEVGVVHETPQGWIVTNFKKRQFSESFERTRQWRERHRDESSDAAVTDISSSSPSDSSSVSVSGEDRGAGEGDTSATLSAGVFKAFENNIGLLTSIAADRLKDDIDQYSAEWVLTAIEQAIRHEKRSLAYVEGCLRNWKRDGLAKPSATASKAEANEPKQISTDETERLTRLAAKQLGGQA